MFSSYRRVLSLPGALVFSGSGLVARMPLSMVSLGIVVLVSSRTGSYSLAGTVTAAYLIANATLALVQARLIDRLGQTRVLAPAVVVFATGLAAMMASIELDAPTFWPHLWAALAGASLPQIGSAVRARWSHAVPDKEALHTAFALESVLDEVVFIVGPALVTILATLVHPLAGLVTAATTALVGTAVLVSQKRTEPTAGGTPAQRSAGAMPWGALAPMILCAVAMGALLGGAEVATVAFSDEQGAKSLSGLMLAIWAAGSLVAGVITGALPAKASNLTRFRRGTVVLALTVLPLPFVDGFLALGVALFVSGCTISPTLIAGFASIEETVPAGRLTEGITLFTTGLGAGLAPGAALVGLVVDASGASASYWVTVGAGLLGAALVLLPTMSPDRAARKRDGVGSTTA